MDKLKIIQMMLKMFNRLEKDELYGIYLKVLDIYRKRNIKKDEQPPSKLIPKS